MALMRAATAAVLLGLAANAALALPLWELTGTANRITLLGSIHILRETDYPLDPALADSLAAADVVIMELDLDDLDPTESAGLIASLALDPDGRNLQELIGGRSWQRATRDAQALGIDLAPLLPFEPWYAAVLVTQLRLAQLGFDPALGIEARMAGEARRAGKEIRGLETLAGQLGALDRLSAAAQREFFQSTIEEAATFGTEADRLIRAWKAGDLRALDRELLAPVRRQPDVYRSLIVERNVAFTAAILALADDGTDYLVIVGALHLVGADSVLRMLERRGLKSQPIGRGNRGNGD